MTANSKQFWFGTRSSASEFQFSQISTFFHSKNLSIVAGSNIILFRSFIQVCFVDKTCEENFDLRLLLSDLSASLSLQYTLYVIPYQSMSKHVNLLLESETSNGML